MINNIYRIKIEGKRLRKEVRILNMKPRIKKTKFGSITIAGEEYKHDVIIHLDGKIEKRKKKLSKEIYGTSHILSQAEAEDVYEPGAVQLIFGTGQSGMASLSPEAETYLTLMNCHIVLLPTPAAIQAWNAAEEPTIGLFHVTC
jgi:hypothetical protein